MKGRCRYCKAPVVLMSEVWKHDGIGAFVHIIKQMRDRPETQADFALAGPNKGSTK